MAENTENIVYPKSIVVPHKFGGKPEKMIAAGIGKYPYECGAKTKYPNAMIYRNEPGTAWIHSEDKLLYKDRNIELDEY